MANKHIRAYAAFLKKFLALKRPTQAVLDCSNGPVALVLRELQLAGSEMLNADLDGNFPAHSPNPLAPRATSDVRAAVVRRGAEIGVVFDADGDRAVFVDDRGREVPSYLILYLLSLFEKPPFVGDVIVRQCIKSSFPPGLCPAERDFGGVGRDVSNHFIASRVGFLFVKQVMREKRASIGAEYSGHYYFKDFFFSDSALLAVIKVMNALSRLPYSLSDFVDLAPKIYRVEFNVAVTQPKRVIEKLERKYGKRARAASKKDGLLLEFDGAWFLARPSNTEPLLRVFAGASTSAAIRRWMSDLKNDAR